MPCHHFISTTTRRDMLRASACGFGHLALAALAGERARAEIQRATGLVPPQSPHFRQRARRIIFLFMWGGPSHVDLFDPKPRLNAEDGKQLAGKSVGSNREQLGTLLGSPFRFAQYGEGGIWMSELFPQLSRHADKLCVVRSIHTEGSAHGEAMLRLHTGQANLVRQVLGLGSAMAWEAKTKVCRGSSLFRRHGAMEACRIMAARFCHPSIKERQSVRLRFRSQRP